MSDPEKRRPKVCVVQYNASARFLMRADRAARTLGRNGWDVVAIAIKDDESEAYEERDGYVVKRVELTSRKLPRWTRPLRFIEAVWRTYRAASAEKADVYDARDIYPMLVTWLAAKRRGAKFVYDSDELNVYRNWPVARRKWWPTVAKAYEGFFCRRADLVITSDYSRSRFLHQWYRIRMPETVLNVPDLMTDIVPDEEFRSRALKGREHLLIYQGGLVRNRGLNALVSAMKELPECALALVGFGHLADDLRAQIVAEGLQEQAEVFDAVPFPKLMGFTAAADVGMLCMEGTCLSYVYGVPNKVFEYMMAGIPQASSHLHDIAEMVLSEDVGVVIEHPEDSHSIAESVRCLLGKGPEALAEIGSRGRERVLERYNWGFEKKLLIDAFDSLGVKPEHPGQLEEEAS